MSSRRLITSPAFQFYPQDWLVGTQGMSLAGKGAYIQIIAFGWLKGALTFDLNELAKLIGCTRAELDGVWPEVLPKLRETKRGFVNRRVEQSRGVLRRYRESKRKAALTRWAKEKPQAEHAPVAPALGYSPSVNTDEVYAAMVAKKKPPRSLNPHHKPTNLINGANLRRHGSHAWCAPRDGLCVPQFLHEEFLGKSNKPAAELLAWYASSIAALNGHAVGEDALVFWRNTFAGWVGTVTAAPDTSSRQARNNAGARKTLTEIRDGTRKSIDQVVHELIAAERVAKPQ